MIDAGASSGRAARFALWGGVVSSPESGGFDEGRAAAAGLRGIATRLGRTSCPTRRRRPSMACSPQFPRSPSPAVRARVSQAKTRFGVVCHRRRRLSARNGYWEVNLTRFPSFPRSRLSPGFLLGVWSPSGGAAAIRRGLLLVRQQRFPPWQFWPATFERPPWRPSSLLRRLDHLQGLRA